VNDSNKLTGRGRSTWEFMDVLRPILEKDPSINPPCVISAGCAVAVSVDTNQEQSTPLTSETPSKQRTGSRKRRNEMAACIEAFTEKSNKHRKKIAKELKALVQEERRRNDLFEKYIETLSKQ